MAVVIRLARIGKKKAPFFRIVAVDKRKKRDGQYLENLGTYNPVSGEIIQFHADKLKAWIAKGALPSDTVERITKQFERGQTGPRPKVAPKKQVAPVVEKIEAPKVEASEAAPAEETSK